jgi:transposase
MAMGVQQDRQDVLMVAWQDMPRSPGHAFYDRLQDVLIKGGFDTFAEAMCRPYYSAKMGAKSIPPGRYFRMHLIGYFEGLDSERGIEWRCSDSFSLRDFLRLEACDRVPDHSWLSKTRARLPKEAHETVFDWVLALIAKESGIETPTAEDLVRLDKTRKNKTLSNAQWQSSVDPDAKIARMKDGTTHLAYKPEHAVDLDTGAILAAPIHSADTGDTTTVSTTLATAEANLAEVGLAPTKDNPAELIADKGYHSHQLVKDLQGGVWTTRIAEPERKEFLRWHGDDDARKAVYANRRRLLSGVGKQAMRDRGEIVERTFAHNLDRGGMRRAHLRVRENVSKRYLIHVCGHNLGLLMRKLIGAGTPRQDAARAPIILVCICTADACAVSRLTAIDADHLIFAAVLIVLPRRPPVPTFSTGC